MGTNKKTRRNPSFLNLEYYYFSGGYSESIS